MSKDKRPISDWISEEIATIQPIATGGSYWYDGLSWLPDSYDDELDSVYFEVFDEMLRIARENGAIAPIIHHNGNGHYVACDEQEKKV